MHTGVNKGNGVLLRKCIGVNLSNGVFLKPVQGDVRVMLLIRATGC